MSDAKREKKFALQRKKRGFDDSETWNLDDTFVLFIVPRLEAFKEIVNCYPNGLTMRKWKSIIQQMIDGFKEYENRDYCGDLPEKVDKSLILFAQYFTSLWW